MKVHRTEIDQLTDRAIAGLLAIAEDTSVAPGTRVAAFLAINTWVARICRIHGGIEQIRIDPSGFLGRVDGEVIYAPASAAQYERRLISQRTKDGLAAKRAAGVRLGRPSLIPAEVVQRIVDERAAGTSIRGIAASLNSDSIPTAKGKPWTGSTIQAVLNGQDAAKLTAK